MKTVLKPAALLRRTLYACLAAACLVSLAPHAHAQDGAARKIVVEMFTSQGCSSCPPADALLGDLAERDDVIALSLHVDYWDYLGWKDPFASKAHARRQRAYAAALGSRQVYTPQAVIQGAVGLVGSQRSAIEMALKSQTAGGHDLVDLSLSQKGGKLVIGYEPTPAAARIRLRGPLSFFLIGFDGPHSQNIKAGENSGHKITYHNVVRDFRAVGEWRGEAGSLTADIDPKLNGYVVIVQAPELGPIYAAEWIMLGK